MDLVLLQAEDVIARNEASICFNPYFNGSSTSTMLSPHFSFYFFNVSILILMDLVLLHDTTCIHNEDVKMFQSLF